MEKYRVAGCLSWWYADGYRVQVSRTNSSNKTIDRDYFVPYSNQNRVKNRSNRTVKINQLIHEKAFKNHIQEYNDKINIRG